MKQDGGDEGDPSECGDLGRPKIQPREHRDRIREKRSGRNGASDVDLAPGFASRLRSCERAKNKWSNG
jgi:hypothetical protein